MAGMLIMKHVGKSGMESVVPVGSSATFTAPEDGEISYRINDTTFYDNTYKHILAKKKEAKASSDKEERARWATVLEDGADDGGKAGSGGGAALLQCARAAMARSARAACTAHAVARA